MKVSIVIPGRIVQRFYGSGSSEAIHAEAKDQPNVR